MSPQAPVAEPIATALLLGYVLNWGLFGALTVQTYLYHISFSQDGWLAKAIVYVLFLIETTQTILVTRDSFNTYVRSFGNFNELDKIQMEWLAVPLFSGLVSCTVQMYYAYRLKILSGSKMLWALISTIALAQCTAGVTCGILSLKLGRVSEIAVDEMPSTSVWLVGCASCDVIIAFSMGYYMSRQATQIRKTRHLWITIVRSSMETGCLTAVIAMLDLILFFKYPQKAYHACLSLVLAKLYSNSLLVVFNSQIRIIGARNWEPQEPAGHSVGPITSQETWDAIAGNEEATHQNAKLTARITLGPREAAGTLGVSGRGEEEWSDVIELDHKIA